MSWKAYVIMTAEALLFIALIIFILVKTSNRVNEAEHNMEALKDTMEVIQLSNGALMYEKSALLLEKNQLDEYLGVSKKEYKELEKKLNSKLSYISKLESQIKVPVVVVKDSVVYVSEDTTKFFMTYDTDKWLKFNLNGTIIKNSVEANLYDINMNCPLKVGLTDDYKLFVTSENPYMTFSDIDAAVIDERLNKKKKQLFNLGVQAGFGAQYNMIHKTFDFGPYIGVGFAVGFDF